MKPIRLSDHARQQVLFGGCSVGEVGEAIQTSPWEPAELGRSRCRRNFRFEREWHGVWCATKQVRPIFVDEPEEIVVVTVYVYYFSREGR